MPLLKRNNTSYIRPLTSYIVSWSLIKKRFNNPADLPVLKNNINLSDMKVVLLAGGFGSRISEESQFSHEFAEPFILSLSKGPQHRPAVGSLSADECR